MLDLFGRVNFTAGKRSLPITTYYTAQILHDNNLPKFLEAGSQIQLLDRRCDFI